MRPTIVVLGLLEIARANATWAQEAARLRLEGSVGQRWTRVMYSVSSSAVPSATEVGGDTTWVVRARVTGYWTRTVISVSGDTLTFADVHDSAIVEIPGAGIIRSQLGSPAHRLTTTVRTDTRGRVISTHLSGVPDAAGATGMEMRAEEERRNARGEPGPAGFPERAVGVGDCWVDSTRLTLASGQAATRHSESCVKRIDVGASRRVAVVEAVGTVTVEDSGAPAQTFKAEYTFDLNNHVVMELRETLVGRMTSAAGFQLWKWDTVTISSAAEP